MSSSNKGGKSDIARKCRLVLIVLQMNAVLADSEQDISHISNWSAASGSVRADTDPLFSAPELGLPLCRESPAFSLLPNPAINVSLCNPVA